MPESLIQTYPFRLRKFSEFISAACFSQLYDRNNSMRSLRQTRFYHLNHCFSSEPTLAPKKKIDRLTGKGYEELCMILPSFKLFARHPHIFAIKFQKNFILIIDLQGGFVGNQKNILPLHEAYYLNEFCENLF
ncbi:hypothetical protein BpHYR1_025708 [Brachionus plicatilis]|uniref:Uncharacterized protein n=1 Tax=Brachionus plicatilis TaxID=10195 RepID=A0A3M7RF23_BRAPC|nr:hypothetical protein BpHYR1_025708 [Brachionus plicatilis]